MMAGHCGGFLKPAASTAGDRPGKETGSGGNDWQSNFTDAANFGMFFKGQVGATLLEYGRKNLKAS